MNKLFVNLLVLILAVWSTSVYGLENEVNIKKGMSKIIKIDNAKKVDILKDDVVNATILSDKEIIIEGKKEGTSALNISTPGGMRTILVNVKSASDTEQMIEVDVQIVEIIYNDKLDYGIDWPTLIGGGLPQGGLPLTPLQTIEQNPNDLNFLGGTFKRGQINAALKMLLEKDYAKLLAKPKLRTLSGKKAEFLSGGELPYTLVDSQGKATVQWKEYGIKLSIEPVIDKKNTIIAKLRAEASSLDYINAVSLGNGGTLPSLRERWADTTISMEPEDTVIIAGLMQNDDAKVTSGVPILSDIPLLGEIFKSTHTENKRTELVIFVTPKIGTED
jgi:pilus assembly protein CpaC